METILLYLILSILLFQLFIFAVLTFKPTNSCCKEDCCCDKEKSCDCDKPFIIEGYNDEEKSCSCKGDNNLVCKCGQPKINDFSGKTKVSALGTPENMNKSFRGNPYKDEHTKQLTPNLYGDDDFATPTKVESEPLEENDPNINKK